MPDGRKDNVVPLLKLHSNEGGSKEKAEAKEVLKRTLQDLLAKADSGELDSLAIIAIDSESGAQDIGWIGLTEPQTWFYYMEKAKALLLGELLMGEDVKDKTK